MRPLFAEKPAGQSGGRRIYEMLSGLGATACILGLIALLYAAGSVFPQGAGLRVYALAGARPLVLLLFINLALCSYERYKKLIARKAAERPSPEPTHTIALTQDMDVAAADVRGVLATEMGFRSAGTLRGWTIVEKGLPHAWLSWAYHAGILAVIAALGLTWLLSYEGTMPLRPGRASLLRPSAAGRLQGLLGHKGANPDFLLVLDAFTDEYSEHPQLDYPSDMRSRLAIGLGWRRPRYTSRGGPLFPRDSRSMLRIVKNGLTVALKTVGINDPLKYDGYTFYHAGIEQRLKIRAGDNPIAIEARTGEWLLVPGLDSAIRFSRARAGTIYKLDGTTEELAPFVTVTRPGGPGADVTVGRVGLNDPFYVDGKRLTLVGFEESPVIGYRYDPGAALLRWSGLFVIAAMSARLLGRRWSVAYRLEEDRGIVSVVLSITSSGLAADPARLASILEGRLTRDDIRPEPIETQ